MLVGSMGLFAWSKYELGRDAYKQYQQSANKDKNQAAENIATECAIPSAPVGIITDCLKSKLGAYQDQDTTNKDLQAQQDMALWALLALYVGAGSVIASFAGLILLLVSLRQTSTAIKDTREIGEAQVRAYLICERANLQIADNAIQFDIHIYNRGQTPAYGGKFKGVITFSGTEGGDDKVVSVEQAFGVVPPGDHSSCLLKVGRPPIEKELYGLITSNKVRIGIEGAISWSDVFGGHGFADHAFEQEGDIGGGTKNGRTCHTAHLTAKCSRAYYEEGKKD